MRCPWRALAWLALLAACADGSEERVLVPVARLVDRVPGRATGVAPPLATIDDDSRMVLGAPPSFRIYRSSGFEPAAGGRVALAVPVPPALRGKPRVVVEVFARAGDRPEGYRLVHAALVPVEQRDGGHFVRLDWSAHPELLRGEEGIAFYVEGRPPPASDGDRVELPPLTVPPGASLGFAIGILESAWGEGPVEFSVQACDAHGCAAIFSEVVDPAREAKGRWRERSVSLADREGSQLALRFESRALAAHEASFSFPLWANPTVLAPVRARAGTRNLILVSLDTLRADHLPSWGYPRDTAPFVEAGLARRGTLFEAAVAPASTTAPSHMTLMTSLPPSVHGVRGSRGTSRLADGATTLAEALRAQGFATAAVTEGGGVAPRRGFERGFETFVENAVPLPYRPGVQAPVTFDAGLAWLARHRDERFFLFLHSYETHTPYAPPPGYAALFRDTPRGLEPPPELAESKQPVHYDREIRHADDALARFVSRLEAEGLLEDTLLVLTSDHGEEFLEHGNLGHGATLPEQVLHVPLVLVGPGLPAGRRVAAPVGLVDLAPTLLELLGAPELAGAMGRSFAAIARGEDADAEWLARPVYSEAWYPFRHDGERLVRVPQPTLAVRVGPRKLVRSREGSGFRYAYFDLARDPGERRDRYAEEPQAARDLRELLDGYEAEAARRAAALGGRAPAGSVAADPEQEERLRALGYLD